MADDLMGERAPASAVAHDLTTCVIHAAAPTPPGTLANGDSIDEGLYTCRTASGERACVTHAPHTERHIRWLIPVLLL